MNIDELTRYGVDSELIDTWRDCGHERLLPVQWLAVQRYDLFAGKNLIISAPTSSGKTFVGEMAAAKAMHDKGKVFYLVPLKAIASEKFRTFRERYGRGGARVVASSRDYREYDQAIDDQDFDIAVVVYEKMQQILARNSRALHGVRLVVADELQMLTDKTRGADLEMLLTQLKLSDASFQFLGLSAVLKDSVCLSRWLDAAFLECAQRPLELHQGIVFRGEFHYRTYNSHEDGVETLPGEHKGPPWRVILSTAAGLAEQGEQSLVFVSDKASSRGMAVSASEVCQGAPATEAIEQLMDLEETQSRDMLLECLQRGVAFHNADMSLAERAIVERGFREGEIWIICATPTLATGVNLPAKNVLLDPMLWDKDRRTGSFFKRDLTKAEYDNMSGRAGRLSMAEEFGRSILVARSPFEYRALRAKYLDGQLEDLQPQLSSRDLTTHTMNLIAAGLAHTRQGIAEFLANTLTGMIHWRALTDHRERFHRKIAAAVKRCIELRLVKEEDGVLVATSLGELCAVKGISANTGNRIRRWLDAVRLRRSFPEIEAIYMLCRTQEARDQHVNMSTEEYRSWKYSKLLAQKLSLEAAQFFGEVVTDRIYQTYEEVKAMKMALMLDEWAAGHRAIDIEGEFESLAGTIRAAGEVCGWLANATAAVADMLELPEQQVRALQDLSTRLVWGVPDEGVPLCRVGVRGFGRTHVQKLLGAGIADMEALRVMSEKSLRDVLGKQMGPAVWKFIDRASRRRQRRRPATGRARQVEPRDVDAGQPNAPAEQFNCRDRFHFDGTAIKRRTVITVNGVQHEIPNKTFAILLRLAMQLQEDGVGWVQKGEFGDNPQQIMSRARKDIRGLLTDPSVDVLESDAYGSYRLSVPPGNVTFDWAGIGRHWDGQIKRLSALCAVGASK